MQSATQHILRIFALFITFILMMLSDLLWLYTFSIGFSVAYFLLQGIRLMHDARRLHAEFRHDVCPGNDIDSAHRLWRLTACILFYTALWCLKDLLVVVTPMPFVLASSYLMYADTLSLVAFMLFIFELVSPHSVTWQRAVLLLLPLTAVLTIGALIRQPWFKTAYVIFIFAYGLLIWFIAIKKQRRYTSRLKAYVSNLEQADTSFYWQLIAFYFIAQFTWLVFSFVPSFATDALYYALNIIFWQLAICRVRGITYVLLDTTDAPAGEYTSAASPLLPDANDKQVCYQFDGDLEQLVIEQKLYLDPDLTLPQLARIVHSNRTYLSRYLSQTKGETFYDFIGRLRLEMCAIRLLTEQPQLTIEGVATESGFKSVSTFRRAFVRRYGIQPSTYREQHTAKAHARHTF